MINILHDKINPMPREQDNADATLSDKTETPVVSEGSENGSVTNYSVVKSALEPMQTEKRVHRPHAAGSLLIATPCSSSLHRDRVSPPHPVVLHVHANNHFLYGSQTVGRSSLLDVATDHERREMRDFEGADKVSDMEPTEGRVDMDEDEVEEGDEADADDDDEEVEVDVCHSPDLNSPSPVDLTHSSRDPEFHTATISCSPFPSRGTPDSSIHLHALSCLHQGNTANGNSRYLTYTGTSSTTTTPTPSATTTPTSATNAVQHKRGLAFSVENILDPNKFTGGRHLHVSHRGQRRGSSIHEGIPYTNHRS